ncbi:hypothetical protein Y1Q_0016573 [Alligator mississippiensis]|uniref:Sushi domain-containing protein n=1 Tax=Alligator mississippiensis TaxID=8496 RepID=A0A151MUP6_ALLMI|nr:hypothetical protein Y1Q_0016573 [Alligator mississippiensis]
MISFLVTCCPNPEIRNGRKLEGHGSVYDRGDKVSFECNDGYVLKGSYEIQCRDDGTWAPPAPTCSLVGPCPPPPALDNRKHTAQGLEAFHTGMSVSYSCDPCWEGAASIAQSQEPGVYLILGVQVRISPAGSGLSASRDPELRGGDSPFPDDPFCTPRPDTTTFRRDPPFPLYS